MQRDRKGFSGNLSLVLERAQTLQQLQQQRAAVLERLELLLSHKQLAVQQAEQLHAAASNVEENKQRVSRGRSQLRQVKEHTKKLQQELQLRRNVAEQRAASLARQRLAHCSVVLPQDLRTHELASLHARMGLLGEQRVKVLQLLDILPLRLEGLRAPALTSRAAAGAAASAASALPSRAAAASAAQHPGGGPGGGAPPTPSATPHAQPAGGEPGGGADAQFLLHPPPSHHHHHPPHHHHHHHHYHLDHRHPPQQQQQQHWPALHPPVQPVEQDGGSQGGGRPLASQQSWHGRPVSHSCGSGSGRLVGRQQQEAGSFGPLAGPAFPCWLPARSPPAWPLSEGEAGSLGRPPVLTIVGLRLPDQLHQGDWHTAPQALSAALGYMLLLLDLLSAYLGSPLLHEGSYQGSTTVVWQQQSFWNRRPSSSMGVLPLFVEAEGLLGSAPPTAPSAKTKTSLWASLPLLRAASGLPALTPPHPFTLGLPGALGRAAAAGPGPACSPPSSADQGVDAGQAAAGEAGGGPGRRQADLLQAFHMVLRSCACLVKDALSANHAPLPALTSPPSHAHMLPRHPSHPPAQPASLGGSQPPPWPPASMHGEPAGTAGMWGGGQGGGGAGGGEGEGQGSLGGSMGGRQEVGGGAWPPVLPDSWSPWGWLAVLASALLQGEGEAGAHLAAVLPAASLAAGTEQAAQQEALGREAGREAGRGAGQAWRPLPARHNTLTQGMRVEALPDDSEGWDVVQPILPPPPSDAEDVEQYARAMFADGNTHRALRS